MSSFFQLGNIVFDNVSSDEAINHIIENAKTGATGYVVTPNSYHCLLAEKDQRLAEACASSTLCLADGMPIVWASIVCGQQLKEKISGSDLVPKICQAAGKHDVPVFFMGGMPGEAELAAMNLKSLYPNLKVVGTSFPPFGFENDSQINSEMIAEIKNSAAKIVFVGVGTPKQEKWIARHQIPGVTAIGVGMSIAFCAGTQKRAPVWMQNSGLEWFFRLCQEPKRLARRYLQTFWVFALIVRAFLKGNIEAKKR